MSLIFYFSAQPGAESQEQSGGIVSAIIESFFKSFSSLDNAAQASMTHTLTLIVRKCAHMGVYFLLSVALCNAFFQHISGRPALLSALAVSVLYAAGDELHQLFVPGRSGMVGDVLIDAVGAGLGVLAFCLLRSLLKKFKKPH